MSERAESAVVKRADHFDLVFFHVTHFRGASYPAESSQVNAHYDQLNVILDGVAFWDEGSGTREAGTGEVVYFPRGCERREWNDPARPLECIIVLFLWLEPIADLPRVQTDRDGRMRLLAESLLAQRQRRSPYSESLWRAEAMALLANYVNRCFPAEDRDDYLVFQVRHYIMGHLDETIRLDDLAAMVRLNKYHFSRRYKAATGRSPMEAVRRYRTEQARFLIMSTDATLGEIASDVGLAHQSHLARLLRRYYGQTATELRRGRGRHHHLTGS